MSYQNQKNASTDVNKSIILKGFNKHFEETLNFVTNAKKINHLMFLVKTKAKKMGIQTSASLVKNAR